MRLSRTDLVPVPAIELRANEARYFPGVGHLLVEGEFIVREIDGSAVEGASGTGRTPR